MGETENPRWVRDVMGHAICVRITMIYQQSDVEPLRHTIDHPRKVQQHGIHSDRSAGEHKAKVEPKTVQSIRVTHSSRRRSISTPKAIAMKLVRRKGVSKKLGNGLGDGPVSLVPWIQLFRQIPSKPLQKMVGATGFEPVTSTV